MRLYGTRRRDPKWWLFFAPSSLKVRQGLLCGSFYLSSHWASGLACALTPIPIPSSLHRHAPAGLPHLAGSLFSCRGCGSPEVLNTRHNASDTRGFASRRCCCLVGWSPFVALLSGVRLSVALAIVT